MCSKEERDSIHVIFADSDACSDCQAQKLKTCNHRVCPMCLETVAAAQITITKCKHIYCKACMLQLEKTYIESTTSEVLACPCCRTHLDGYYTIDETTESMFAWIVFETKSGNAEEFFLRPFFPTNVYLRRQRTYATEDTNFGNNPVVAQEVHQTLSGIENHRRLRAMFVAEDASPVPNTSARRDRERNIVISTYDVIPDFDSFFEEFVRNGTQ